MSLPLIFGLSLALLAPSVGCNGAGYSDRAVIPQDIPRDLKITLERTECFGFCPVYKLTITADGSVVFEGRRFVKQEGVTISSVSPERLKQLMAEFDRVNFFSLEDDYSEIRLSCPTDQPSAVTSIRIKGKSKTVNHYLGCLEPKVPKGLTELENKIDEIVNTAQWLPDKKER
ncbi:MAG TPA: DUF6438 domain-containing protein [Blastocatellia bacterium]|jgi:hypothetical protein|nr:DUF6438 domain-containing protein [Blastocatellia bacterium]